MMAAYGQNQGLFSSGVSQVPGGWGGQAIQPQPQPTRVQPTGVDGVAFVQGYNAALAFIVDPGKRILLLDTVEDRIYFKSADQYGVPYPLEAFWVTRDKPEPKVEAAPAPVPVETKAPEYVTREEFDALREQIETLAAKKSSGRPRKEIETEGE